MIRIYVILVFVVFNCDLLAQENKLPDAKNALFIDCATIIYTGNYAINYERQIYATRGFRSMINFGIGGWYSYINKGSVRFNHLATAYTMPLTINSITGTGNNHFEFDLGVRFLLNKAWRVSFDNGTENPKPQLDNSIVLPVCTFGYRYQKRNSGVVFRAFIGSSGIGLGIGHAF